MTFTAISSSLSPDAKCNSPKLNVKYEYKGIRNTTEVVYLVWPYFFDIYIYICIGFAYLGMKSD